MKSSDVHTPLSPAARKRGSGTIGIVATTRFMLGSMRWTNPLSLLALPVFVIQTLPNPNTAAYEYGATLIRVQR